MLESINRLNAAYKETVDEYDATGAFPAHPRLEKLLRVRSFVRSRIFPFLIPLFFEKVLQISWQQEANDLVDALARDAADPDGGRVNVFSQLWRWWATVLHGVILVSLAKRFEPSALAEQTQYCCRSGVGSPLVV